MENSVTRLAGLILRIIALVLALILLALASATIGLIRNNRSLIDKVTDVDTDDDDEVALSLLVVNTERTAYWLIILAVSVVIAEIVAIVVLLLNVQAHRLCRDIQQVIFSFIVAFFYLATGIACALYANAWAATPEECKTDEDFDCTEEAFTATNALQAVSDTHN
ncbi:hypothetical protein GBAR_LOCUS15726 [Geodia barretti]|uniref:MARVEL domain-containing protein n=1 Tax=Geodia barretti TaxID=519541 RepID=A0AA35WN13_GEOBA|nr:hypothetical protein GBAR_LOCUS15726 [Geodia barretti]